MRTDVPGYWMNETTGALRPSIHAYLEGIVLSREHVLSIRAYFRQWMGRGDWRGAEIPALIADIDRIMTRRDISRWLQDAMELGIDPL
jgi:hypothetical protein